MGELGEEEEDKLKIKYPVLKVIPLIINSRPLGKSQFWNSHFFSQEKKIEQIILVQLLPAPKMLRLQVLCKSLPATSEVVGNNRKKGKKNELESDRHRANHALKHISGTQFPYYTEILPNSRGVVQMRSATKERLFRVVCSEERLGKTSSPDSAFPLTL